MTKVVTSELRRLLNETRELRIVHRSLLAQYGEEYHRVADTIRTCLSDSRSRIARVSERIDRHHGRFSHDEHASAAHDREE